MIGVTLMLLGLAFVPLTGGISLMMLIPGVAVMISTGAGIGIGTGLCLTGFIFLCSSLWRAKGPPLAAQKMPEVTDGSVAHDVLPKVDSANRYRLREHNAGINTQAASSHKPSAREIARRQELETMKRRQVQMRAKYGRQAWIKSLSDSEQLGLKRGMQLLELEVCDNGQIKAQLGQLETEHLGLGKEQLKLQRWAKELRAKGGLEPFAELPMLRILERQKAYVHARQLELQGLIIDTAAVTD